MFFRSALGFLLLAACTAFAAEKFESFDTDPRWDGLNNRPDPATARDVVQDFGYSATAHSGDTPGEIGGTITPDGVAAFYAKALTELDFTKPFSASGVIYVPKGPGNTFLGFFNHNTVNEWRPPNALGFRINGRGETFHVHSEYATSKWRANAGVIGRVDLVADRVHPIEHPGDTRHTFFIEYRPDGPDGTGMMHAKFDDVLSDCVVPARHKEDGAIFNHFGFLNIVKSVDSPGALWIRDLVINGEKISLDADPKWAEMNNRKRYRSEEVRPRFNIGHEMSNFAGGAAAGEIGGLFFRGDCRETQKLFYYGDKIGALTLNDPLMISGKITLRRGVSDSTSLFGFDSKHSVEVNPSQSHGTPRDFFGFAVEGPSGEGFYVYPTCRSDGDEAGVAPYAVAPRIYPDAATHDFSFRFDPATGDVSLSLDDAKMTWRVPQEVIARGATFDRLGFVSPWIDGNGQRIYLDELKYTVRP